MLRTWLGAVLVAGLLVGCSPNVPETQVEFADGVVAVSAASVCLPLVSDVVYTGLFGERSVVVTGWDQQLTEDDIIWRFTGTTRVGGTDLYFHEFAWECVVEHHEAQGSLEARIDNWTELGTVGR